MEGRGVAVAEVAKDLILYLFAKTTCTVATWYPGSTGTRTSVNTVVTVQVQ